MYSEKKSYFQPRSREPFSADLQLSRYNMVLHQPSIVGKYESGMYGGRRARGYFQHKSIYHKVCERAASVKIKWKIKSS